jgi:hypothetical protein
LTDSHEESEIAAIVERLRSELEAPPAHGAAAEGGDERLGPLPSRRRADRLWAVTAERPYLARAGAWGRARGSLLMPPKAVLRRAMRWYVEPLATDQRQFNATALRLVDELHEQVLRLEARLRRLEERSE